MELLNTLTSWTDIEDNAYTAYKSMDEQMQSLEAKGKDVTELKAKLSAIENLIVSFRLLKERCARTEIMLIGAKIDAIEQRRIIAEDAGNKAEIARLDKEMNEWAGKI